MNDETKDALRAALTSPLSRAMCTPGQQSGFLLSFDQALDEAVAAITPLLSPAQPSASAGETPLPNGVSIILIRDGKFAVSQRLSKLQHPHLWQFAGGHVELGEEPLSAAKRELHEETGLLLPLGRFEFIGTAGPLVGYKGEKYIGHRYGVVLRDGEEPTNTEPHKHTNWEWVEAGELLKIPMLQATKEFALAFALTASAQRVAELERELESERVLQLTALKAKELISSLRQRVTDLERLTALLLIVAASALGGNKEYHESIHH